MTLTEFLEQRLAEDEAVARAAGWHGGTDYSEWEYAAQPWGAMRVQTVSTHGNPGYEDHVGITHDSEGLSDSVDEHAGAHIARHDPARVLAQCAALRRIVDLHWLTDCYQYQPWQSPSSIARGEAPSPPEWAGGFCSICVDSDREPPGDGQQHPCDTLRALAIIWRGHPDYREEWT